MTALDYVFNNKSLDNQISVRTVPISTPDRDSHTWNIPTSGWFYQIALDCDSLCTVISRVVQTQIDSNTAAPGIAGLVHAARKGNLQALQIVSNMAKQMLAAGGDMGILSGRIRPLIEGERDPDKLTEKMSDKGQRLMLDIIEELIKLEAN